MAKKNSNRNQIKKSDVKRVKRAIKKAPTWLIVVACILLFAVIGVGIYGLYTFNWDANALLVYLGLKKAPAVVSGELDIHFLELGNKYAGDCIYIKCGDIDVLIDAGSKTSSLETIKTYLDTYVTDGIIEYCIVTHAHSDHYANFAGTTQENTSLFDFYEFKMIIDFPKTNQTDGAEYNRYLAKRDAAISAGATHYNALQCYNETDGAKRSYVLSYGITMDILYNYYYENNSSSENDYSVCNVIRQGSKQFLFTGDLEEGGEKKLLEYNTIGEVELYKAGHHGSKTSTCGELMAAVKPKICVVTCVAGSDEYTDVIANQFPTQLFVDNIAPYTSQVYVTSIVSEESFASFNGNIIVSSTKDGTTVNCSASNTVLKDTEWFRTNRTIPSYWA